MTHLRHREHHQLEKGRLGLPVRLFEQARARAAGVVDEPVDVEPGAPREIEDLPRCVPIREIGGEDRDVDAVPGAQIGRDRFELVLAPRDEQQIDLPRGELIGELDAEPGRGAGDQGTSRHGGVLRQAPVIGGGRARAVGR